MNFKKSIAIALSVFLLLSQAGNGMAQGAGASADNDPLKIIKDCEKEFPQKTAAYSDVDGNYEATAPIDLSKPLKNQSSLNFRIIFEKTRSEYHALMECVFEGVVKEMLGSAGSDTSGIFGAKSPNLPEWSKPESACANSEQGLTALLERGSPKNLLAPLLSRYNAYADRLMALFWEITQRIGEPQGGAAVQFDSIGAEYDSFQFLVENEIQDALASLDGAFIGLKEMRKAFVMHVHFQCMLKNLEFYRRAMENLRRVISALPSVIENASTHK